MTYMQPCAHVDQLRSEFRRCFFVGLAPSSFGDLGLRTLGFRILGLVFFGLGFWA